MGVPRFFSWISKNYSVIINPIIKPNEFYFDLNCLLHPVCFSVANEVYKQKENISNDILETKMFNKIIEYITEILDYIQPKYERETKSDLIVKYLTFLVIGIDILIFFGTIHVGKNIPFVY